MGNPRATASIVAPAAAALLLQLALLVVCWTGAGDRIVALAGLASFACAVWTGSRALRLPLLSPAMLYLFALGVFHLGLAGLWALAIPAGRLPLWFITWPLAPALTLVIVAIACYQIGLTLACSRSSPAPASPAGPLIHNTVMYRCGLFTMTVGFAALVVGAWQIGFSRLLEASYFESYQLTKSYDPRLLISSLQIVPIGLYLAAASAPRNRIRLVLTAGLLWGLIIFLAGYRGFALAPLVVLLAIVERRGAGISRRWLLVAGVVLLLIIPAAKIARDKSLNERTLSDLTSSSSPLAAVHELGGSVRPLVHTLVLMETEDLRWGYTYLQAAWMIVPDLALEWRGGGYRPIEELPPSHWVTRIIEPWIYARHGGLGFSAVAEPYMNFGMPGVLVYFTLLGFALVRFDLNAGSDPLRIAVWAMVLGPLLWTARNSYTVFLRPAVWGIALVWAAHFASRVMASRQSAQPHVSSSPEQVWSGPNRPLSAKEGAL